MSTLLATWRPRLVTLATQAADDDGAHDLNHLHRVWHAGATLLAHHPEADATVSRRASRRGRSRR